MDTHRRHPMGLGVILFVFFATGVEDAMGPMADAVRAHYAVSHLVSTLLTSAVFLAFALLGVPAGLLAARLGKRTLLTVGLGINAVACGIPAVLDPAFPLLLLCVFALGAGTTCLHVAANPMVRDAGAEGAFARNLSLAHFVKGLGSAGAATLAGAAAFLPLLGRLGWRGAFPVFLALMVAGLLRVAGPGDARPEDAPPPSSPLRLLGEPPFALATLGIFLYVGAEVCLARFLRPALVDRGLGPALATLLGPTVFFAGLTLGRLVGLGLLAFQEPRQAFRWSALAGACGVLALVWGTRASLVAGTVICGLSFANIWPLLFALTVERRPERAGELSGLLCMAISGGAVLPLVMGALLDHGWGSGAFIVPLAVFAFLALLPGVSGQAV
jgi:fucose permease